jgi:hypothetical protein
LRYGECGEKDQKGRNPEDIPDFEARSERKDDDSDNGEKEAAVNPAVRRRRGVHRQEVPFVHLPAYGSVVLVVHGVDAFVPMGVRFAAMTGENDRTGADLQVLDAFDHPHGGRILRVRTVGARQLSLRGFRGASIRAVSPEGTERIARILSLPLTGGKAGDQRFRDTGRVDLLVEEEGEGPPISLAWRLFVGKG